MKGENKWRKMGTPSFSCTFIINSYIDHQLIIVLREELFVYSWILGIYCCCLWYIYSEGSSILFALMIRQIPSLIAKKHAGFCSQFGAKVILTMSKKFLEVTSFETSTSLLLILFVDYPINCWKACLSNK